MEKRRFSSPHWSYALLLVLALVMFGAGVYFAVTPWHQWALLAAGSVAVVLVLAIWPIACGLSEASKSATQRLDGLMTSLDERLQQLNITLNMISEQQLISDRAKQTAYRQTDREALRRAIQEEISRGDYEAALSLVSEMDTTFGYRSEAERFREDINSRRADSVRKQVNEGIAQIDRMTRSERWAEAIQEASRLGRLYPDAPSVQGLAQEIENRRQNHKRRLLDNWQETVDRKDIDGSIEILKQLDLYLTPQEAQSLQDSARHIFKEKLMILRQQFATAAQEKRWADAVQVGTTIVRDFPNAKLAEEVREMMPMLQQRAANPDQPAQVG